MQTLAFVKEEQLAKLLEIIKEKQPESCYFTYTSGTVKESKKIDETLTLNLNSPIEKEDIEYFKEQ